MSEVNDTQTGLGIVAGNTVATLAPQNVVDAAAVTPVTPSLPSAADLDAITKDIEAAVATGKQLVTAGEQVEVVGREEFEELQDAFLRLTGRVDTFNTKSPHKI